MIKWTDYIGPSVLGRVKYDGLRYGIELEYERMVDRYPELHFWHCERDPSLRNNGVEFISLPIMQKHIPEALEEIVKCVERYGLDASWRCGLHTHLNVTDWTWRELIQTSVLYLLVEPYIFEQYAPGRNLNHFCVPVSQNTRLVDTLAADFQMLRAGRARKAGLGLLQSNKYSALNYKPINIHGTLEFRHMQSTTDPKKIVDWCYMLGALVDTGRKYNSPEEIITEYEDIGIGDMLTKVGLHTCELDDMDIEDSYISACLIAGHEPMKWQDLNWDFNQQDMDEEVVVRDPIAMMFGGAAGGGRLARNNMAQMMEAEVAAQNLQERMDMDILMDILEGDE